MNKQELTGYMYTIVDMEKSIWFQQELLQTLQQRSNNLCIEYSISKPKKREPAKTPFPSGLIALTILFLFVGIGGLAVMDSSSSAAATVFIIAGVICGIAPIAKKASATAAAENAVEEDYRKQVEEYNRRVSAEQRRLTSERNEKLLLESEENQIKTSISKNKQFLSNLYSLNIIYPKYRKLEYVCSLYEYLCSGRCTQLEGHEGGYNILEQEVRMNYIITQLDQVRNNLNSLQNSQRQLYDVVTSSNEQISSITKSNEKMVEQLNRMGNQTENIDTKIKEIQKNSELSSYYTERSCKLQEYMSWMNYRSGDYHDAGYQNKPPY